MHNPLNRLVAAALCALALVLGGAPAAQAQLGVSRPKGQDLIDGIIVKVDNQIVLRSTSKTSMPRKRPAPRARPCRPTCAARFCKAWCSTS
ncbi:hypothetical protein [Hymenobacter coccineus]|uniref:hypothetical protein n=1 Tax=Hymenobacter coccineus TaxID=1908235 RepID=UPI000F790F54|nr:hypothetical protein [Hymenobacter coccineus]